MFKTLPSHISPVRIDLDYTVYSFVHVTVKDWCLSSRIFSHSSLESKHISPTSKKTCRSLSAFLFCLCFFLLCSAAAQTQPTFEPKFVIMTSTHWFFQSRTDWGRLPQHRRAQQWRSSGCLVEGCSGLFWWCSPTPFPENKPYFVILITPAQLATLPLLKWETNEPKHDQTVHPV